jgi:TRAP-type C4-dicarboxylate transport system permease small subunit
MKRIGTKILDLIEVHLATWIFILLLISISIEVFSRYVLNKPTPRFFEISIYTFIWSIYLGAALAKRYDQHIRFDIFYRKFPLRGRLLVDIVFDLLTSLVMLYLLFPSLNYTIWNYRIKSSALRVPWTYLLMCFPLFVILILVHNARDNYTNVRIFLGKAAPREEALPWL